jgi:hypothetical protein
VTRARSTTSLSVVTHFFMSIVVLHLLSKELRSTHPINDTCLPTSTSKCAGLRVAHLKTLLSPCAVSMTNSESLVSGMSSRDRRETHRLSGGSGQLYRPASGRPHPCRSMSPSLCGAVRTYEAVSASVKAAAEEAE